MDEFFAGAACFVFLQLLEALTENESKESWWERRRTRELIRRREESGNQLTEKLSSSIIHVVKRERLSSTIMGNLNALKVNGS